MVLKVRDMMNLFGDMEIVAGEKGLNRIVKTVTVMDAPDIYNWLKGGEFLITTGYIMKDDPIQMKELIIKIDKAGAAALGVKLKRFIDELPKEILDIANEINFPVVNIPIKYSFADIINPVLTEIINQQARRLLFSEKIHRSFTELVIKGGNTQEIIDTLGKILKKEIAYYDLYFEQIYVNKSSIILKNILNNTTILKLLDIYKNYPVEIDNWKYGHIIILDEKKNPIDTYEETAIEHSITVLKLDIQKKISNLQVEIRYRDEFIQDMLMNNIKTLEEVNNRASLYGWDFSKGAIVVIADIDDFKIQYMKIKYKECNQVLETTRQSIFMTCRKVMKCYFPNAVYTNFSDSIVFLVMPSYDNLSCYKNNLRKVCDKIRIEVLRNNKFTITVGIGSYKSSPLDIHISYEEAKKAIKLGRIIYRKNKTVFYEQLGSFKLLVPISDTIYSKEFCCQYLGKLIEYDKQNNTNLVHTLKILVKNDWNLKITSEELFIHYNTMKYRFNKICEILDMDLKDSETKLNIAIALKILQITQ